MMSGGYSSVQRGGDLSGPIWTKILEGTAALLEERVCDAVRVARELVEPLLTSQAPGVAEIAEETRDTAVRVLAHLECDQQQQSQPVQQTVEAEPSSQAPKGPKGQLPPPLSFIVQPRPEFIAPNTRTAANFIEAAAEPSEPPIAAEPSESPIAAESRIRSIIGAAVPMDKINLSAVDSLKTLHTAALDAAGTPGEGPAVQAYQEALARARSTYQSGNVPETARRRPTRVTYQNSRPSPPSTTFPSPPAEQKQFAAALQAARTGPSVQRKPIVNNPNLTTVSTSAPIETESARSAREAREARLKNAGQAGLASRTAADAAETARLQALRQKGGRRTHKSKGRKNNRKSRRQQ
jgi:hypothetical protein